MNPEVVFLRAGGLGDFILTLPLIKLAHERGHAVRLYAKNCFIKLLDQNWDWLESKEIDELSGQPPPKIVGAIIISFWTDHKWVTEMLDCGASKVVGINPRPITGESFLVQASQKLGWSLPENYKTDPILGDHFFHKTDLLWIHPGSGGSPKNLPLEKFITRAYEWLDLKPDSQVNFSFGEADSQVLEAFELNEICEHPRVNIIQPESVLNLKKQLLARTSQYLGNDSGPGHLAANLGIPTEIWFRSSNWSVWQPNGPRVVAYDVESDSRRIL